MAKLLYSATMSVDGFIAGPGGDMSWLTEHLGPNPMEDELIRDIGALLVGNRSFRGDDPHRGTGSEGKPFGGGWSGPQFVLTHNPPATSGHDVTFVDDLRTAIDAAKEAAGDKYVNVIGANVAAECLDAGKLDEILVLVAPVLLGDGVRLSTALVARTSSWNGYAWPRRRERRACGSVSPTESVGSDVVGQQDSGSAHAAPRDGREAVLIMD